MLAYSLNVPLKRSCSLFNSIHIAYLPPDVCCTNPSREYYTVLQFYVSLRDKRGRAYTLETLLLAGFYRAGCFSRHQKCLLLSRAFPAEIIFDFQHRTEQSSEF